MSLKDNLLTLLDDFNACLCLGHFCKEIPYFMILEVIFLHLQHTTI